MSFGNYYSDVSEKTKLLIIFELFGELTLFMNFKTLIVQFDGYEEDGLAKFKNMLIDRKENFKKTTPYLLEVFDINKKRGV